MRTLLILIIFLFFGFSCKKSASLVVKTPKAVYAYFTPVPNT